MPEEGLYERSSAGGRGLHRSRVDSAALHNPWRELGDEPTPGNALPPHRFVIAGGDVADKCGLGNTLRPGDQSPGYERKRSPPEDGSGHVRAGGRGLHRSRIYSAAGKDSPRRIPAPPLAPRAPVWPAFGAVATMWSPRKSRYRDERGSGDAFPGGQMGVWQCLSARGSNPRAATEKGRRLKAAPSEKTPRLAATPRGGAPRQRPALMAAARSTKPNRLQPVST